MNKPPVLDPRSLGDIMDTVAAHARQYTPEWRYEGAADDPGAAIAQLFGEMFCQTVDRFNAVPGRLYTEFLELIGVQMPDPAPARGLLQFSPHGTVEKPVPVPAGTQLFVDGPEGEQVVYETERAIETSPARLTHLFYADSRAGVLEELALDRPQLLFASNGGANLLHHRFSISQDQVLTLEGPCQIEVEIQAENRFASSDTAKLLTGEKAQWTYRSGGKEVPFDRVEAEGAYIHLTKAGPAPMEAEEDGHRYIRCSLAQAGGDVCLAGVRLRSQPQEPCPPDSLSSGDVAIDLAEGGYCFGRRPMVYSLFYIRCDQVFSKRGATANVHLEIAPIITEPRRDEPQYNFTRRVIDKEEAAIIRPDDVFVDQVVWEYFNGRGWTSLAVVGNRNPFSCKETGALETVFQVPENLKWVEVNGELGLYVRARVVHVENQFSQIPRWIVPFVKDVRCAWKYSQSRPIDRCRAENNGAVLTMEDIAQTEHLQFPAIQAMAEEPQAMYLCFDRSPHALPLSLLLELAGEAPLDDKLFFQAWTGNRFDSVRSIDLTHNLGRTGLVLLYLTSPVPQAELFGQRGCWLKILRSSYLENSRGVPRLKSIRQNVVPVVQRRRVQEQWFDTGVYDAGKVLLLTWKMVQDCQVWVDEVNGLSADQAEELEETLPGRVRLEREDGLLRHCWVRWERLAHLALADGQTRGYELESYEGTICFGDGIHGRVPPAGTRNIHVTYATGGGEEGNQPAGAVRQLMRGLPRISRVENLTPMSGGSGRVPPERLEALGSKRLRHRDRAVGAADFEELVAEAFPQTLHVKCFPRRDGGGREAPGHVTVVVEGRDQGDGQETLELCARIFRFLEERCSCTLTAAGGLHVVPSTVVTVNTSLMVEMEDLTQAAVTQQAIDQRLEELINRQWRRRDIGDQVRVAQLWQAVRDMPNVRRIHRLLAEGEYEQNGMPRCVPLEDDRVIPYATVQSGAHRIEIC